MGDELRNFGEQLVTRGNEPIPTSLPNGEEPTTAKANSKDANENETDYIITTDSPNDVNDAEQIQNERMKSDVTNRNEASEANKNGTPIGRIRPLPQKSRKIFAGSVRKTGIRSKLFRRKFC